MSLLGEAEAVDQKGHELFRTGFLIDVNCH